MIDKSFGRTCRLTKGKEFNQAIERGRKIVGRDILLWFWPRDRHREANVPGAASGEERPSSVTRLGTSISRKLGGAVERNRMKRLLREAFRLNRHRMKMGYDLVAYPRPGCRWRSLDDAEKSLLNICHRAGIVQESK